MFSEGSPVYLQLAAKISDDIVAGVYAEGSPVPSATDFAIFYEMNPATASKAVNVLVDQGVLYKKRGIGMFVGIGARETLRAQRREQFAERFVDPLVREAEVVGISGADLARLIESRRQASPASVRLASVGASGLDHASSNASGPSTPPDPSNAPSLNTPPDPSNAPSLIDAKDPS